MVINGGDVLFDLRKIHLSPFSFSANRRNSHLDMFSLSFVHGLKWLMYQRVSFAVELRQIGYAPISLCG